jgi:hypothetical protein
VPADSPFDGIGLPLDLDDFTTQFLKTGASVGYVALDRMLKNKRAFFYLFGMLLESIKRGRDKYG